MVSLIGKELKIMPLSVEPMINHPKRARVKEDSDRNKLRRLELDSFNIWSFLIELLP
jgi:hypothetical protein